MIFLHKPFVAILSLSLLFTTSCSESDVDETTPNPEEESSGVDITKLPTAESFYSMPLPPEGQRWIVNEQFTDEFNGTELDSEKWYDYHPDWAGRAPGLFESKNVSVSDGNLVMKSEYMEGVDKDSADFYISCAAVISKTQEAHFGYYESRFKASKTTMSMTFWLSTHGTNGSFDASGVQPDELLNGTTGKYSQELDICECIGDDMADHVGEDGFTLLSGVAAMTDGSSYNAHCFYTPTGGSKSDYNIQRSESWNTNIATEGNALMSEDYHIAACWWRDETCASYYLDNGDEHPVTFNYKSSGSDGMETTAFYLPYPMSVNLVMETYSDTWINLPFEADLADETKNKNYYDWVRAYTLVDIAEPTADGAAEMTMFDDRVKIELSASDVGAITKVSMAMQYTARVDRNIMMVVYDEAGEVVASETFVASAGYANIETVNIYATEDLVAGDTYYCVAYIGEVGADLQSSYISGDHFEFVR